MIVDCINRQDVNELSSLMTDDHVLEVFDELLLVGRGANVEAWQGYFASFPSYLIHPRRVAERGGTVAILGHTTGSHLGLPDAAESSTTLIWLATVVDGAVRRWRLVEDTSVERRARGLTDTP